MVVRSARGGSVMTVSLMDIRNIARFRKAGRSHSLNGVMPHGRFYARRGPVRRACLLALILGAAGGLSVGCGGATSHGIARALNANTETGTWAYLDAAVIYASTQAQLGLVDSTDHSTGTDLRKAFHLITVRDEDVFVEAQGEVVDGVRNVTSIEVQVSPFRDSKREQAFVRDIERRIARLKAGGGVAPG